MNQFSKFMQVNENEEYKSISLPKESERVLSLLHTRDKNNSRLQDNVMFSNCNYHIQDINEVQHKSIKMTCNYQNFLDTQLLHISLRREEEILFFRIFNTGCIHNLL